MCLSWRERRTRLHWELTRAGVGVFVDVCLLLGHMQLALLELGGLDEVLHWWQVGTATSFLQKVMEMTLALARALL